MVTISKYSKSPGIQGLTETFTTNGTPRNRSERRVLAKINRTKAKNAKSK